MAFFSHFLAIVEKKPVPKNLIGTYKVNRNISIVVALILIISIAPFFGNFVIFTSSVGAKSYDLSLRNVLWFFALFSGWSRYVLEKLVKIR